ncbi:MAG TPA: DUF1566 domain-containing protein [Bacteroidales bacterium]|nr:DUF1566 domain-containing protein [Bacteroidales bacterium]
MRRLSIISVILLVIHLPLHAQVAVSDNGCTPTPSAAFEVNSATKGFLGPRVALTSLTSPAPVTDPVSGLMVYNTNDNGDLQRGYYFWNATITPHRWVLINLPNGNLQGDMLCWNGVHWIRIPAGNVGDVLTFGAGKSPGMPVWNTAAREPAILTDSVTAITSSTALGGGNVSDNGAIVTERGLCYSTMPNPTVTDDTSHAGAGSGTFGKDMDGLEPNTTYYVRAYATNEVGTGYGTEKSFTTPSGVNTITTTAASTITTTSATGGGNILSGGGAVVSFRGVCWNTFVYPTVANSHTTDGSGIGSFPSSITGLTSNTLYYFRAYAVTTLGTFYGNSLTITTPLLVTTNAVTSITQTTASGGGNISPGGGAAAITARGLCWDTAANPTILNSHTTNGTGSGNFSGSLTGLTGGTLYYVRAYGTTAAGTFYGNEVTFTTSPATATVVTFDAYNILTTAATSGGNVVSAGGAPVTARGICWGTSTGPTVSGSHTTDGSGTGTFISSITGLSSNHLYYVRAYATSAAGTAYGNDISFTTLSNSTLPTVSTAILTNITSTSATSGGNVTTEGGSAVIFRGVCWSTSSSPTIADSHTTDGSGTGAFVSSITGLTPNTNYYVRAYAMNSAGTAYGTEVSINNPCYVGAAGGGGIVFYIDGTGKHGLISAEADQSSGAGPVWGCENTSIPGTSAAVGSGQANTTLIVNGCATAGIAARICDTLTLNGYTDWFLPSKDELYQMYQNKALIGSFYNDNYWSSTENDAGTAWNQSFYMGTQSAGHKHDSNRVRAIRSF